MAIKSQSLLGAKELGRPGKGGVLKAVSTVGRFTMAWRWRRACAARWR
jgi:hypothetical protein